MPDQTRDDDTTAPEPFRPKAPIRSRSHGLLLIVLSAVVVAVAVVVTAWTLLPHDEDRHPGARSSTRHTVDCHLVIVERGFSIDHPYLEGHPERGSNEYLRYALLVKNPCPWAAYGVTVYAVPKTKSGKKISDAYTDEIMSNYALLDLLLPGRTVGMNGKIEDRNPDSSPKGYEIRAAARVDFNVTVQCWTEASEVAPSTRSIAKDVQVGSSKEDVFAKNREVWLTFTLQLEPVDGKIEERMVEVIFRDHSGKPLGGSAGALPEDARVGKQKVRVWVPIGADLDKTKVYLTTMESTTYETPGTSLTCISPAS